MKTILIIYLSGILIERLYTACKWKINNWERQDNDEIIFLAAAIFWPIMVIICICDHLGLLEKLEKKK